MVCGLISVAKRIVCSMVSFVSPGRPRMKVPWMVMPSSWQSLVNRRANVDAHALLDVVQDLLVAGLVADQQQAQAVVAQHLEGFARHVGLGVARPGDAELAQLAGDRLGARQVVGEGVVVEEEFLHLREGFLRPGDLLDHVADAARAVAVAADGLRPQAEGAARFAAAPGVDRDVGMLEVADEIVLDAAGRACTPASRRAARPCFRGSARASLCTIAPALLR